MHNTYQAVAVGGINSKGYTFVKIGREQYFLHVNTLYANGFRQAEIGADTQLVVVIGMDYGRPCVVAVKSLDGRLAGPAIKPNRKAKKLKHRRRQRKLQLREA